MPTTAEVEARLRRTAAACEPLVDDLMGDPPALVRAERPRRTGWLVAAALVAVAAVGGAVAVNLDDGRSDEVRSSAPDGAELVLPSTDPAAGHPRLTTPVDLPDGSHLLLEIPGPERWVQADALALLELGGGDEVEVRFVPDGAPQATWTVDEQVSSRAALVSWGDGRYLAVGDAPWTALVPTQGLADETVAALAEDLNFTPAASAPVEVGGPGITVIQVGATVDRDAESGFLPRRGPSLEVWRATDGAHPLCAYTSRFSTEARCLLDGQLRVEAQDAFGNEASVILPGIEASVAGADSPTAPVAQQVPVSFADGTQVVLTVPGSDHGWSVRSAVAFVTIEGVSDAIGPVQVQLVPETDWGVAALNSLTLEEVGDGLSVGTSPQGMRSLLLERDGWTAMFPIDNAAAQVSDQVLARLIDSIELEATAAGPSDLRADGLEVTGTMVLVTRGGFPSILTDEFLSLRVDEGKGCETGPGRCLGGGRVGVSAGDDAQEVLSGLTLEVAPPR